MKPFAVLLSLCIGTALMASPMLDHFSAEAAQTKSLKKKKKPVQLHQPQRVQPLRKGGTNFRATGPNEPNGAAISDFCAHTLEIYGRMGVGCNKYGRDYYLWDN